MAAHTATARSDRATAEQGMPLILIVDDSPTEVHVMQKALERHGYQTASAGDGAEAIRKAKEMKPDLIFMDVVMPGVNGFQATRKLASDPDTKSIPDRKSTRLNSSHLGISYAVFCLKKKNKQTI